MARIFTNCLLTFFAFLALSQSSFAQTINAGTDITRCNGQTNATLGATNPGNKFVGTWTNVGAGTGTFSNVNAINSTFTPTTIPTNTTTPFILRWTVNPGLVISQIYTEGGNASATYLNDFVELHNRSNIPISLAGRSLQYSTGTGSFNTAVTLTGTIPAGGFFLVQLASGGANGVALPTANLNSTAINMDPNAGKIALVSQTAALGCSTCSTAQEALIIDMVSWGAILGTNTETNSLAGPLGPNNSARRNPVGTACTDTNNNINDFTLGAVLNNVRNNSSPVQICSAIGFDDVTVSFVNISTANTVTESSGTANDGTITCGASAAISATGIGTSYAWASVPAGFTSAAQNITVTPVVNTTYTCTVTSNGCTATTSRAINVVAITANTTVAETSGTANNDGTICNGASVSITANGGTTFLWGATGNNSNAQTITVSPTANTTYTCTVTDANGCSAVVSRLITVNNLPTVNTTVAESSAGTNNDGTLCFGASGSMTATGGATYLWSPATFLSATNVPNPTVSAITATTAYTVTATTAAGCSNTASRTLTVIAPPSITINVTENSGTPNDATIFAGSNATMTASGASTYSWSPAATLNSATGATVTASPTITTTYTVTATDANQCRSSLTQQIIVQPGSPLTVTETSGVANDGILCPGASATISATGGISYLWSTNANNAITSSVTVSPTSPSNVYTCTVTDAMGNSYIVSTTINVDIIPAAINLVENSGIANDGNICLGGSATLNAAGGGTYSWSSSPTGLSSTASSVTVTPTITTTYVVTVTNPTTGCIATASRKLTVVSIPSAATTVTENSGVPNNNMLCVGGSATLAVPNVATNLYNWASVPAGFSAQIASVTVTPTVTTTYNVTVTNPSGCTALNSVTVTVQNPNTSVIITEVSNGGNSSTDGILCQGGTADLTAVAGQGTYAWVSPYGETSNTNVFTVSPTITTTYTLTITSTNGCTAVRQVVITVTDPPSAMITATEDSGTPNDNVICNGTSAVLTAVDGYDAYSWRSNPTGLNSTATSVTVSPTATTTYLLTVTNDGCSSTSSLLINVLPRPTAPITVTETSGTANDGRVCFGTSTTLSISGGVNYLWSLNAGGGTSASVNVAPTATSTYSCTVTGANGCSGVSNFTVTVTPTVNINVTENSGGNPNDAIICAGGATTITASGANQYIWRSNPTGTNAATAAISMNPTVTTTYLLTATDVASGCTATLSQTINVLSVPPQTIDIDEFSGVTNDGKICAGSIVNLYGPANGVAYQWASVPAGLNSTASSLVVSPSVTTTYSMTVTNAFGCTAIASRIITVNPVITLTETSATPNDGRVCLGSNVTLDATTAPAGQNPVTYQWSSIPAGFTSNLASITFAPTATTIYTVSVNDGSCIGTNSVTVNVLNGIQTLENAGIPNDNVICAGNEAVLFLPSGLGYTWTSIPAGFTATTSSITVTPTVTTTYNVAITGSGCAVTTATSTVTIAPSNLTVVENSGTANDAVICNGASAIINAPAGQIAYQWSSVPAGFTSTASSITVDPTQNTTYTVTITNIAGCTSVSSQSIAVLGPGSLYVILTENSGMPNDDKLCFGVSGTLEANIQTPFALNATYTWSPAAGLNSTNQPVVTASPTVTTTYNVTVNAGGCILNGSKTIEVAPRPTPTIVVTESSGIANNDNNVCNGDQATLTASGGFSYLWSDNAGNVTTDVVNVTPTVTTTYTVTVTGINGCTAIANTTLTVPTASPSIAVVETSGTANDGNLCKQPGVSAILNGSPTSGGTYLWTSFPPGFNATTASVTVTPTVSTTYNLQFTSSTSGCKFNVARDIVLIDIPSTTTTVSEVSGTPNDRIICQGTSALVEVPAGAAIYTWSSNPPGFNGTNNQILVTPNSTITLTISASTVGCGTTNSSTVITVLSLPNATITGTSNGSPVTNGLVCLGNNLVLTAPVGAASYNWNSSPTGTTGTTNTITVTPTQFTAYNLTVTSTNQNACQNFNSFSVTVVDPPSGNITVTDNSGSVANDGNICSGSSATLMAPIGTNYTYSWSSNPTGFIGNTQSVSPSPTITTTYTVTVSSSGCTQVFSSTINVSPNPSSGTTVTETSGITPNDGTICRGDNATITAANPPTPGAYSYFWNSPDGFAATTQAITVAPTVTTTYSLVVTDNASGCTSTSNRIITVNALPNNTATVTEASGVANDAQICYSGTGNAPSVTISVPAGATYSWVSDPSGFTATTAAITVAPTVSTTYNVTITQNGCVNTTSQFINVSGFPTATVSAFENSGIASNDGNICAGATVTVSVLAGQGAYSWSSNPAGTVGVTAAINVNPTITTTYTVTVTNAGGCSTIGSNQVTVTNTSVGTIEAAELSGVQNDGIVCSGSPVVLTAMGMATGGPVTYGWSSIPAGATGTVSVLNVSPTVTTTYIVTATPSNGSGCPATQAFTVTVLQAKAICKTATLKLNTPSVTLNVADVNNGSIGTSISIDKTTFTCFNTGVNKVNLKVTNGVCEDTCNATVIISDGPGCNPLINPLAQDEAKISDPCQCTGTPTNLQDGKFTETVVVDSAFTGQNWVIRKVSGLYTNAAATIPFAVNAPLTATPIGGGYSKFTLNGFHIDSIGYTIEVWRLDANGVGIPGSSLSTSNRCFYPTPVYRPYLPLEVPIGAAPFNINPIDINAGNNTNATVTNTGNGVTGGNTFNPAVAGTGTWTITSILNYGPATSSRTGQLLNAPICASTVTQRIKVVDNTNLPPMACKSVVNYTLERDCTAPVLAGDFLLGAPKGFGGYMVTIMDGNTVVPQVNASHVNKYLTVKITDLTGNSCWSTMLVEDKTAPIVDCSLKKVFYCEDNVKLNIGGTPLAATPANAGVFMLPNVRECSKVDTTFYDEGVYAGCSTDSVFFGKRYFTVKDLYGNTATCAVDFEIRRRYFEDIRIPKDTLLSCSEVKGGANTVGITKTGSPTIKGKKLSDVNFCGFSATYTDAVVNTCGNSFTIQREWVISSNCSANTRRQIQIINVKDLTKPVINVSAIDATINADITSADCNMGTMGLPIPKITDNCDPNPTLNITVRNSNGAIVNTGPVVSNLPVGNYIVFYAATDACGNIGLATRNLVVRDASAPHPVCRTNVEVSLSRTNSDYISALSLDGGSTDNCCLDVNRFEVARMNGTTVGTYAPSFQVKCSDRDLMVALRIWDCNGNSNVCMTNVKVFDKLPPLAIPENITVTCGSDATAKVWLDDNPLKKLDKAPTSFNPGYFDHEGGDATCIVTAEVTKVIDSLDNCGNGFYAYEWTVTDQSNNKTVVQQRYVSSNSSPFTVIFPKDTVIVLNGQCDSVGTATKYTGEAIVNVPSNSCPVISKSYFDQAVKLSNDSVCFMITRVWRVSNLCKPMPATGLPLVPHTAGRDVTVSSNDINNGYFEYQQRIRVIDLVAPTITNVTPILIEPVDKLCKAKVTIQTLEAKDCSGQNINQHFSLAKLDGTIIPVATDNLPAEIEFDAKDFGDYRVVYRISDDCGNTTTTSQIFKVKDVLKPTPVCHDNLSVDLGNSGLAMIQATMFDAGSFDNCSKNLKIRIRVLSDSIIIKNDTVKVIPDTLPTMYTFKCPPKGIPTGTSVQWKVQLWVGDESGNWDFCETSIDVQDNMLICNYDPNEMRPLEVVVKTEKDKEVENVNVQLQGSKSAANFTSKLGKVNFTNLPSTGTYQVIPEKKTQPLNGVTTFDLVLISKHILAVQPLTTPYQYIAADVNRNGAITTADVVELRKMILAIQNDFSKNTSWRFVDKSFQFPKGVNPLSVAIPEKASLNGILPSQTINFVGVKVGDVNSNATTSRSAITSYFSTDEKSFAKDEIFTTTFANHDALDGYQFTFEYDKNNLELIDIQGNKEGFGVIENGLLTVSQILTDNSDASFSMTFKAKKNARLSESVHLTSNILNPEAYDKAGNIQNAALTFNNKITPKFELYQNQPNPFHHATMISFSLPESGAAKLIITDVTGKVIKVIGGDYAKGFNQIAVDKSDLGTHGVFYYTLESANQTATKKMIIVE